MKICGSCQTVHLPSARFCNRCDSELGDHQSVGNDLSGSVIDGKYALVEHLAEGGMAWVYQAVHVPLGRTVIVKILKTQRTGTQFTSEFTNEVQVLSGLNHPHIVSIIDAGRSDGGLFYFVTEFIPGQTLHDLLLLEPKLPLSRTIGIMHQVLAAAEEAHARKVIHRDLSPANIWVSPLRSGDDFVKVIDFGIALLNEGNPFPNHPMTYSGTAGYIAPECIEGRVADETSDIYALGVIFYKMLTADEPFEGEDSQSLLRSQKEGKYKAPSLAARQLLLSPGMDELFSRALSPDPSVRYSSVSSFRQALISATQEMGRFNLRCDKCVRPKNPMTGVCEIHGLQGDTTPAKASRAGLDWKRLTEMISRDGRVPAQHLAEGCTDFLLGHQRILEIVGDETSPKTDLANAVAQAASALDLQVVSTGRLPTGMEEPWGQARKVVGAAIGIGIHPSETQVIREAIENANAPLNQKRKVGLLWGLPNDKGEKETSVCTPERLIRAAVDTVAAAPAGNYPDVLFVSDLSKADFASRDFFRAIASESSPWQGKLIVSGHAPFFSGNPRREEIRLDSIDEPDADLSRLEELSEEAKELYFELALLGFDADVALLESLADPKTARRSVENLQKRGLALRVPGHRVAVANPASANRAFVTLPTRKQTKLRTRVFEALKESRHPVFGMGEFATTVGQYGEALSFFERAGDAAVEWLDYETAALLHYRRAIHAARWRLDMPDGHPRLLSLNLKQGYAFLAAGHNRAAQLAFKDTIQNATHEPMIRDQAQKGLESLSGNSTRGSFHR